MPLACDNDSMLLGVAYTRCRITYDFRGRAGCIQPE